MKESKIPILPELENFINSLHYDSIPPQRKEVLQELIDYLNQKSADEKEINLNFICTHNSRRSQLAQVWAQTAAAYFAVDAHCYSGGVEVTAFNPRAVKSLERTGLGIVKGGRENPLYKISFSEDSDPIECFSKMYDDTTNPQRHFATIMTCSHADENCPFIPGSEKRIALNYEDPKEFDGTPQEAERYDECSREIATEMFYAFGKVQL